MMSLRLPMNTELIALSVPSMLYTMFMLTQQGWLPQAAESVIACCRFSMLSRSHTEWSPVTIRYSVTGQPAKYRVYWPVAVVRFFSVNLRPIPRSNYYALSSERLQATAEPRRQSLTELPAALYMVAQSIVGAGWGIITGVIAVHSESSHVVPACAEVGLVGPIVIVAAREHAILVELFGAN